MRPGIVPVDGDACGAALNRKNQPVVIGGAARVYLVHITEILSGRRILQHETPALIGDARRRACAVTHAVECAGACSKKDGGIDMFRPPEVGRVASDIVRRHKPVRSDLALDAQTLLRDCGVREIVVHGGHNAEKGKLYVTTDVFSVIKRKWISPRSSAQGSGKATLLRTILGVHGARCSGRSGSTWKDSHRRFPRKPGWRFGRRLRRPMQFPRAARDLTIGRIDRTFPGIRGRPQRTGPEGGS
jgi:hypothetical protein